MKMPPRVLAVPVVAMVGLISLTTWHFGLAAVCAAVVFGMLSRWTTMALAAIGVALILFFFGFWGLATAALGYFGAVWLYGRETDPKPT